MTLNTNIKRPKEFKHDIFMYIASILSDISSGDCFPKKKRGKYRNLMLLQSIFFLIDKTQFITLALLYSLSLT